MVYTEYVVRMELYWLRPARNSFLLEIFINKIECPEILDTLFYLYYVLFENSISKLFFVYVIRKNERKRRSYEGTDQK